MLVSIGWPESVAVDDRCVTRWPMARNVESDSKQRKGRAEEQSGLLLRGAAAACLINANFNFTLVIRYFEYASPLDAPPGRVRWLTSEKNAPRLVTPA